MRAHGRARERVHVEQRTGNEGGVVNCEGWLLPLLPKSPETADVREGMQDDERWRRNNPDTATPSSQTTLASRPLTEVLRSSLGTVCVAGHNNPGL